MPDAHVVRLKAYETSPYTWDDQVAPHVVCVAVVRDEHYARQFGVRRVKLDKLNTLDDVVLSGGTAADDDDDAAAAADDASGSEGDEAIVLRRGSAVAQQQSDEIAVRLQVYCYGATRVLRATDVRRHEPNGTHERVATTAHPCVLMRDRRAVWPAGSIPRPGKE